MKNYVPGMVLGILSIVSTCAFTGMQVGTNALEILALAVNAVGILALLCFGLLRKKDKNTLIAAGVYRAILFALVIFVETRYENYTLVAIGFLPGAVMSMIGLLRTRSSRDRYKTKADLILNGIGLALSLASLCMVIPDGGFVM